MRERLETKINAVGVASPPPQPPGHGSNTVRLNEALIEAEQAVRHLRRASRAHAVLSELLAAGGRREDAIAELVKAQGLAPGRAEDYEALAFIAFRLGEHNLSRDYYATVTEMAPRDSLAWYNLATSERNIGRLDLAESACNRAISLDANIFQAFLLRSQLKTQKVDSNHIDELLSALNRNKNDARALIFLQYALGKELDDIGQFDDAFRYFSQGANTRRIHLQYDVDHDIQKLKRIGQVFDPGILARIAQAPSSGAYGFILGLPRSGTTMIEHVLTGHAKVRSNGETENFSESLLQALPAQGGDVFERASRADLDQIAAGYAQRAGSAPDGGLVLEKLPLNYLYIGSIHMALPDSKIIVVRRNPVDNCFAMYSTLFGTAYPFSYDLTELARYYTAYDELMKCWKSRLPEQVLEVAYEAFVEDPALLGPRIAEHVGVDWNAKMLKIEENKKASATASSVQIRQPIYKTAAGRWRNYAKHLRPLVDALAADGIDPDASA